MHRREFIAASVAAAAAAHGGQPPSPPMEASRKQRDPSLNGRLKQSACRWCYGSMKLDELCSNAAAIGLKSVELLTEKEWSVPAKYGLTCAVGMGPTTIPRGFNRVEHHDEFVRESERLLPLVKEAGIPNMIVFSGNRGGMDDKEGLANCVNGLKRITPLAESLG